jgi:2-methylcitrate dehydratase PrpD
MQEEITGELARRALAIRLDATPEPVRRVVRHCVLDTLGVTIAGMQDPAVSAVREVAVEEGGSPQAQVLGSALRLPRQAAALLNGTASHVLDYDDVNFALMGHPSVPVLPALLALGESLNASGAALMEAFLAGYETECRIGLLVAPGHYAAGFHATATIGAFGAAVACARLYGADETQLRHALGLAATQAAGLKSMFGTACKPLHAGLAARAGLLAAALAVRGFDSREDALECAQGFAATHGPNFNPAAALAEPAGGWHVLHNLFKYHASCYETHATIECARRLRVENALAPDDIAAVGVRVNPYCDRICNIAEPATGFEAKFSLRATAAMALAGIETSDPAVFDDATVRDATLTALRERVTVGFGDEIGQGCAELRLHTRDGRILETRHDASQPARDLEAQERRLVEKFLHLAGPQLPAGRAARIVELCAELDSLPDVAALAQACAGA